MSKREFDLMSPTDREQFIRSAMNDKELMAAAKELARSGRPVTKISIGEKAATAAAVREATTDIDIATAGRKYFSKDWKIDIDKSIDEDVSLHKFFGEPEYDLERAKLAERKIESEIESRGGKIVDKSLDGKTYVFTVEWPDGKTSEVRYAN